MNTQHLPTEPIKTTYEIGFDIDTPIYISGKISGLAPDYAIYAFTEAEEELKAIGFKKIINPLLLKHKKYFENEEWVSFMRTDIKALMDCTHIYMLKNWKTSTGAIIEHDLANNLGIEVIYQ